MLSIVIPTTEPIDVEPMISMLEKNVSFLGFKSYELIVVVDGAGVTKYHEIPSSNAKIIFIQELNGSYRARNIGVNYAKGDWILFLDSNINLRFDKQVKLHKKRITGFNVHFRGEATNAWQEWYVNNAFDCDKFVSKYRFLPTIALIMHVDVFKKLNGFDDSFTSAGDMDFCWRALKHDYGLTLNENIVTTDIRNKDQILKKLDRQISGQAWLLMKHYPRTRQIRLFVRAIYLLLKALTRKLSAEAYIDKHKGTALFAVAFLSREKLGVYMRNANATEIGK